MKTETIHNQPKSEQFRDEYLDSLAMNPIVNDLPDFCHVLPDDDTQTYTDRVTELEEYLGPGTYLLSPTFGSNYLQDDKLPVGFDEMKAGIKIDTRGSLSADGFFAHEFFSPETGESFPLAFRPHNPESSDSVMSDFARNMYARHLGLDNTQTLGFYLTEEGGGGTISLLDKSVRSLDKFSTDTLTDGDPSSSLIGRFAKELAFLHSKGVVHGDVAKRNIVVSVSGNATQPFLIDWGRSNLADGEQKMTDINTAFHDIRSFYMDFVEHSEDDSYTKAELRELFETHFSNTYINWRNSFFDSQSKKHRIQSRRDFVKEMTNLFHGMNKDSSQNY